MNNILFEVIKPTDKKLIYLIAAWYLNEWKIPTETTINRLSNFSKDSSQFQLLLTLNGLPIATAGIYNHVALLDRAPKFKIYGPWLALVYTKIENRNRGYGELICKKIQEISKERGLATIFLFTSTAESLYIRLGWQQLERLNSNGKDIVVMKKEL